MALKIFFRASWVASILGVMFCFCTAHSQDVIVTGPMTVNNDTTFTSVSVLAGGILEVNGALSVTDSMVIHDGGMVTHALRNLDGLRLTVGSILRIETGGQINVAAKGLLGGVGEWQPGETLDENDNIVAGAGGAFYSGAGGSYGGLGGDSRTAITSPVYGFVEEGIRLGSGGGGGIGASGGNGGGLVRIQAEDCIIDGAINANGGDWGGGNGVGGAGSGGGIHLDVGTLSGSGALYADGGNGYPWGDESSGSGGGGRIALYFDTMTFPEESVYARGGNVGVFGSAGPIYFKNNSDSVGLLVIKNRNTGSDLYSPLRTNLTSFGNITLQDRGRLSIDGAIVSAISVFGSVDLSTWSDLSVNSGVSLSVDNPAGDDMEISDGSIVTVFLGGFLDLDRIRIDAGHFRTEVDLDLTSPGGIELWGDGSLTVMDVATVTLSTFDSNQFHSGIVSIAPNAVLDVMSERIEIGPGMTLIKDGALGASDQIQDLFVNDGGILTHSGRLLSGINLTVTDSLHVHSGGGIIVDGKGLLGGVGEWQPGETLDENDNIVAGAGGAYYSGAGGSYGGLGGDSSTAVTGPAYGFVEDGIRLGSGGGGGVGASGGNGGGLVRIQAGDCIIDGLISANGDNWGGGNGVGGAGSGGGIHLDVGTLSGSGALYADGGNGYPWGDNSSGSGGGGRIVLYFDTMTFPEGSVHARGGNVGVFGSAGPIYFKNNSDSLGLLVIKNRNTGSDLYSPLRTNLTSFGNITLQDKGRLSIDGAIVPAISVFGAVDLSTGSGLSVNSGMSLSVDNPAGDDMEISDGSIVTVFLGGILDLDRIRIDAGHFRTEVDLDLTSPGGIELWGDGSLTVMDMATVTLSTFDSNQFHSGIVSIAPNAVLDVVSERIEIGPDITLIKDGALGASDQVQDLFVSDGGILTHSGRLLSGINLTVTDSLLVHSGGGIIVDSKGLLGGVGEWQPGETLDENDNIVAGAGGAYYSGAGGSYGGLGGDSSTAVTGPAYGFVEEGIRLGSGGGGGVGASGGNGGGLVRIQAEDCIIDGVISANGDDWRGGNGVGGAGSGGGIHLDVGTLSGSGALYADGGNGYPWGDNSSGSGGGGRIALYFDTMTFPEGSVHARGGNVGVFGSPGTIYWKGPSDTLGHLTIDNGGAGSDAGTPILTQLVGLDSIEVLNNGRLAMDQEIEVGRILVFDEGIMEVGAEIAITDSISVFGGGTILR